MPRAGVGRPILDRIMESVTINGDGCWLWQRNRDRSGYGRIWIGSATDGSARQIGAHRAAWEVMRGPIPEGFDIDHLCRVPACVNPAHLEPVTRRVNVARGLRGALHAPATACANGHPYDGTPTAVYRMGGRVRRVCLVCERERDRERKRLQREAVRSLRKAHHE